MPPLLRQDDSPAGTRSHREQDLQQCQRTPTILYFLGMGILTGLVFLPSTPFLTLLVLVLTGDVMVQSLDQIKDLEVERRKEQRGRLAEERVVAALQDAFKDDEMELHHRVQIGEDHDLDIFIRFPQYKKLFALSVKSRGGGTVKFNESRNAVFIRRDNKSNSVRYLERPCPFEVLKEAESWLRKHQLDLFGSSARDKRRSVIRVLVFATPAKIGQHNPNMYFAVGESQFVRVPKEKGGVFLLSEDQVISFVRVHLITSSDQKPE